MKTISAHSYISRFSALGVVVFVLISVGMLYRMEYVSEVIEQENYQAATDELLEAVERTYELVDESALGLTQWVEIYQQIVDPVYYVYWREQRLKKNVQLPKFIRSVELYKQNGKALVSVRQGLLPEQTLTRSRLLITETGQAILLSFYPVFSPLDNKNPVGYLGIEVDLMVALFEKESFHSLDVSQLKVKGRELEATPDEFVNHLEYQAIPSPEASKLRSILQGTLVQFGLLMVFLIAFFYWAMSRLFSTPLQRLEQHVDNLRKQRAGSPLALTPIPVDELEKLRLSLIGYQDELSQIHADLDEKNKELWSQAHHDALTGIFNRRAFDEDWKSIQDLVGSHSLQVSFVLFDCDFFKAINDTYGHDTGDKVIKNIAQSISSALRAGDRLYRMGGDEFAAVLLNTDAKMAEEVAHRCIEKVGAFPFHLSGVRETVRSSVGIASVFASSKADLEQLPKQADMAMYHAKKISHKRPIHYHSSLEKTSGVWVSNQIVDSCLLAVNKGIGLEMHYQPICIGATGEICYYEALMRIRTGDEVLSPASFMPIVEQRNMNAELDMAVFKRIEADLQSGAFPEHSGVSVNLCGETVIRTDLVQLLEPLEKHLGEHKIIIEVTETALITNLEQASASLGQLRERGFEVALDDFGSGYSSIRYLANMPVDIVKFDISMVRAFTSGERSRMIIESMIRIVQDANYCLVCEGIETEDVNAQLRDVGVEIMQGYYFGRPQPLSEIQV